MAQDDIEADSLAGVYMKVGTNEINMYRKKMLLYYMDYKEESIKIVPNMERVQAYTYPNVT
jgi:hypothetical protein